MKMKISVSLLTPIVMSILCAGVWGQGMPETQPLVPVPGEKTEEHYHRLEIAEIIYTANIEAE